MSMRIYILSPYPTVRAGLAALAREQPGWEVVGQGAPASSVNSEPDAGERDAVDVLLVEMDGRADAETVSGWLERVQPLTGVVALGAAEGIAARADRRGTRDASGGGGIDGGARQAIEIARIVTGAGLAFGALPRDAGAEEIIAATTAVAGGLIVLDRRLASEALAAIERPRIAIEAGPTGDEPLTAREREVLQLLASGIPNKQIAQRLRISEHTVKFHVSAIMAKLSAASRTEAVTTAARRGLLLL
jgi:DNA-binding CsgD family transcriptional regulator